MAKGDVVSNTAQLTTGANHDFQPGAGVNVFITGFFHEDNTAGDLTVLFFDGTTGLGGRGDFAGVSGDSPQKFLIDNTNYLRLNNADAATKWVGYTGVQTK